MSIIYINGKFCAAKLTGVQRVGREIALRLVDGFRRKGFDCEVIAPPSWVSKTKFRSILTTLWEQFVLPFKSRGGYLLNFCNTAPIFFQKNQFVVFHDAAVFDVPVNYSAVYAFWAKYQMRALTVGGSRLGTVSKFSRGRLSHHLGRSVHDFYLLQEGCNHVLGVVESNTILDRLSLRGRSYVLAVGSLQEGKNFKNLLKAMHYVNDVVLVIAGGGDSFVFSSGVNLAPDKYIQAGYVSDGELVSLYKNAICFVQASTYEGFGLPVVEAMALGVPVVCSDAASLPEVCGDAAIYFDPLAPLDMARAINELVGNPKLRAELVAVGVKRAAQFNWDSAVEDLVPQVTTWLGCK